MRIFLLGFMGSGKSYWGKIWAERHNYNFIDLDELIEKREQKSIVEIFEENGEDIFRLLETKMLRDLSRHDNCIISCGGGTPCFHDNIIWMNEKGTTVYLSALASYLFEKIKDEKEKRPLIKNVSEAELLFFTEQTLKKRLPVYEESKITLDASELMEDSIDEIVRGEVSN